MTIGTPGSKDGFRDMYPDMTTLQMSSPAHGFPVEHLRASEP